MSEPAQKVATTIVLLNWDVSAIDFMLSHPEHLASPLSADTIKALEFQRDRYQTLLTILEGEK